MDDIFSQIRDGNAVYVRVWLDKVENDPNQGDDHGFSAMHWACKEGRTNIVDMLISRGAKINATNMGDDTALHLAAAHGHRDIVLKLIQHRADINAMNEHGNTPLHYACFWNYEQICQDLINNGALVALSNKDDDTPLDKTKEDMGNMLKEKAAGMGQDMTKIQYRNNWSGTKTRSRDGTLSRFAGIDLKHVKLQSKINSSPTGDMWKGIWQGTAVMAKVLKVTNVTSRISREFGEEFPRLRIFSHPNIHPVLGCVNQPPNLVVLSETLQHGSLFHVLHEASGIVVDHGQMVSFALDIARGMSFLHAMDPLIPRYYLNSKNIMIDEELTAKINMGDTRFSFQNRAKFFNPAWMAPEALQKSPEEMNARSADMWSFAILIWELVTREVPFAGMSSMEVGMKIVGEGLRIDVPPGSSPHMSKLIKICMNEDSTKRPRFDMIMPILERMRSN
ncbi:integrin-linked protein kinase [Strongylocentrotus purpuratus]|uniref:Protein kinase domain-containing protein n=1 Tax=Strongylocentrotus purpuratus TaxID=7668 RepID=A0A7M7RC51_STRPU|nr:integrin-linked protein kinase-like [Strongylocentrotus purpuratus]XP_786444.1 integrin-linked protein kinase [Strongylocentrotus purpuratus]|eukprot:XP_786444.1 PREDICTED: integrin-linked protein kinase [Strongylocentrotus purpuratus]